MTQPVGREGVPVEEWEQQSAYDSAGACERGRTATIEGFVEGYLGVLSKGMKPTKAQREGAQTKANGFFRCVPAEHIYPPATLPNRGGGR